MKTKFYIIQLLFLVSCNSEIQSNLEGDKIPDKFYNVPICLESEFGFGLYSINVDKRITRQSWSSPLIYKYAFDSTDKIFTNSDIEIMFPRYYFDRLVKSYKPIFYIIGFKNKPIRNGFVIIYLNRVKNIERVLKYSSQKMIMSNQIDETTDSVYSTLEMDEFRLFFPNFKGSFEKIILDSICIDYEYSPDDYQFYNSIKLFDFEKGKRWK